MPVEQTITEVDRIERFFRGRKWTREVNPIGEIEYTSEDREWQVQVGKDAYWCLGKFTDSDVETEWGLAVQGRYHTEEEEEGESVEELEKAMVSVGAMSWECPHCGESGGEPVTIGWSEFQGVEGHGGMVNFSEDGCAKCIGRER